MSNKIDLSLVAETLKKHRDISPQTLREVIEELNAVIEPDDSEVKPPKAKQQYVVLVADADGQLKRDFTGWILQIPEEATPMSIVDRVNKAAHDFNASKKGRLLPVKSIGEALESVSRKYFKEAEVSVKTKMPIYLIRTDNKLGEAPSV